MRDAPAGLLQFSDEVFWKTASEKTEFPGPIKTALFGSVTNSNLRCSESHPCPHPKCSPTVRL
jgi:hypothetical protein